MTLETEGRELFEAAVRKFGFVNFKRDGRGNYKDPMTNGAWWGWIARTEAGRTRIEALEAENKALREAMERVIGDVKELADNSEGVAGLHKNGDLARWDELLQGRSSAWLGEAINAAQAALARGGV